MGLGFRVKKDKHSPLPLRTQPTWHLRFPLIGRVDVAWRTGASPYGSGV